MRKKAFQQFFSIDFRIPDNNQSLAHCIGMSESDFLKAIAIDKANECFIQHRIPKRNSNKREKYRVVWQVLGQLEDGYKAFARRFEVFARQYYPRYPHPDAYGYVRGRGILDNASKHCRAALILHADIRDFFPSITAERINKLFLDMGIKSNSAVALTQFVTIEKALPLGLHPSPLIANLICLSLDEAFRKLADKYQCSYTRYADDLTFSSNADLPTRDAIEEVLKKNCFSLADDKYRITKNGQAHFVTGLSVSDVRPRAPRKLKKKLRQDLYYCKKHGVRGHVYNLLRQKPSDKASREFKEMVEALNKYRVEDNLQYFINRIDGMVRYLSYLEPVTFSNATAEWSAMLKRDKLGVSYLPVQQEPQNYNFYIDECEIKYKETTYLALSLVKVEEQNVNAIAETTAAILKDYLNDPFLGGNKDNLLKKGMHFYDSTEDLRKTYSDYLAQYPYKAYVVYGSFEQGKDYEDIYLSLIDKILPHRLMGCDGDNVHIVVEENSKISSQKLSDLVKVKYDALRLSENRCPKSIKVTIGKKAEHICFALPDYLLGIFSNYAKFDLNSSEERKGLFFEKLRDKYRLILDADKMRFYSRKRNFLPWTNQS